MYLAKGTLISYRILFSKCRFDDLVSYTRQARQTKMGTCPPVGDALCVTVADLECETYYAVRGTE